MKNLHSLDLPISFISLTQELGMHQNTSANRPILAYQYPHDNSFFEKSVSNKFEPPSLLHYSSQKNIFEAAHSSHSTSKLTHTHSIKQIPNQKNQEDGDSQSVREKLIAMMREQIQIAINFYSKNMKELLKEQAQQIGKLQQKLAANEKELTRKNKMIQQLVSEKIQTPKKKLSITTLTRHQSSPENVNTSKLTVRLEELEKLFSRVQEQVSHKHEHQAKLSKRIQGIQKGIVAILSTKLIGCQTKLDKYISSREQNMEKIYARASQLEGQQLTRNNPLIEVKLSKLGKELSEIRDDIGDFAKKQYKYENQQIEELSNQVKNLKKMLKETEQHLQMRKQVSPPKVVQIQLVKNHSQLSEHNSSRGVNHKQYGLSHTQQLGLSHLKGTDFTRNQSNLDYSEASVNRTLKNPVISKGLHIKNNSYAPVTSMNTNNKHQQQFEEYQNVDSCYSDHSFYEDDENFSDEEMEAENEARLIQVLASQGYTLPVMVEIDQTGYLKSLKDGMYLVDGNHDGFELSEHEIHRLTAQGVIKVHHFQ